MQVKRKDKNHALVVFGRMNSRSLPNIDLRRSLAPTRTRAQFQSIPRNDPCPARGRAPQVKTRVLFADKPSTMAVGRSLLDEWIACDIADFEIKEIARVINPRFGHG